MPKHKKLSRREKARRRVVTLLAELEEVLGAAGYSFEGIRTSPVPTVFETLLEALRLDGYDIEPFEFGDTDGASAKGTRQVPAPPRRKLPERSAIDRREWKRWLRKPSAGSRGQRIFIKMRGAHAQGGIPGLGRRR